MAPRISELSIRELRARFDDPDAPVRPEVLSELAVDTRRGAQALYQTLRRRREAALAERARIEALASAERELWARGARRVAGIDEAGMAPLAGPVVAAAVVLPPHTVIEGIDDSKRLAADRRDELAAEIRRRAAGVAIGVATVEDIDRVNIYWAGLLAMRRAAVALPEEPEHLLVDARTIPELSIPQRACPKGDENHLSIAAASIIAKTHRDRLMNELDRAYPGYGFARHKGYPTPEHQRAIREAGPCPAHRTGFAAIRELTGACSPTFYALSRELDSADRGTDLVALGERIGEARSALSQDEYRKLRTILQRRRRARGSRGVC